MTKHCAIVAGMNLRSPEEGFVTFPWPDRRYGPFMVQIRMEPIGARFEVVELAIGSLGDDERITGSELRDVRVAELAREYAQFLLKMDVSRRLEPSPPEVIIDSSGRELTGPERDAWLANREAHVAPARRAAQRERAALAAVPRASKRAAAVGDDVVARIYDDAFRNHVSTTRAVAQALGISETAAAKRVHRARSNGFLPPTEKGRAAANTQQKKRRGK